LTPRAPIPSFPTNPPAYPDLDQANPMTDAREQALEAKAWPFDEARKVLDRIDGAVPAKGHVLFQTGYGPSGLPHIGTFAEVLRTTMVRRAFHEISDVPTRLFAFSDDMDGMRAVPENVPEREMLEEHIGKPLTKVPDPFGTHESFGHHNNARLKAFLDDFGFEYEFTSATECYESGRFDEVLLRVLEHHEEIADVVRPNLGEERRATYSPFLPVSPKSGRVLQNPAEELHPENGTAIFRDEDGELFEAPVTGGHCKLQWRVDWAMRWTAFDVDYEMSGKDLIDSVRLSGRICRVLQGRPPEGFTYELFLDESGEKISKSRGNGLTMEEWLAYAPKESLALFMFQKPKAAKRLYFDVIPKTVDDYLAFLGKFEGEAADRRLESPLWHIHGGAAPSEHVPLNFAVLMNLAGVCNTEDKSVLWGFIQRYAPDAAPARDTILDELVGHAIRYYQDFVKPAKRYRAPSGRERAALEDLVAELDALPADAAAEDIQTRVYEVGKRHEFEKLRDWFKALYEILLGQEQGPRMGSFIALYGIAETIILIRRALAGEDLGAD
jgi:lysyl-tRNA synthetase class 1